jgi:hypothetical protein
MDRSFGYACYSGRFNPDGRRVVNLNHPDAKGS